MRGSFAITLSEIGEGAVRIGLLKLGQWAKGARRFHLAAADAAKAVENFRRAACDLVIDYEHASDRPEIAMGGPVIAAGWVKAIDNETDDSGVLWATAEFTSRAREMIAAREYKYLSPVLDWGARDNRSGQPQGLTITSVALTNRPVLDSMPALALSAADGWREIDRGDAADEGGSMDGSTRVTLSAAEGKVQVDRVVCGKCGEETRATDAFDLPAPPAVVRLSRVGRDAAGRMDFDGLEIGAGEVVDGEVIAAMRAQAQMDAAIACGRITPAQRKHYEPMALRDPAGFRELVATLPVQVDTASHGAAGMEDRAAGAVDARIDAACREKIAASKGALAYTAAFKEVLIARPDLAAEYRKGYAG